MFSYEEFWIITLIILLIVYTLGKSKHLINDMINSSRFLNCIQFANDATIFLTGSDFFSLSNCFNNELTLIEEWLNSYKLSLNVSNIMSMIITSWKNISQ